jgi:hypothetical protein
MLEDVLDITPDPKVLVALTQTPLKPVDALCELIDNGIDAFAAARVLGERIDHRMIEVTVPGSSNVKRQEGAIRVVDNGAGLDREGLANTLRAGFSGKNKYDSLGLFGMGFNIATGKLGRKTTVTTARRNDGFALRVILDLTEIVKSRRFEVPVEQVAKPTNFDHGTIVEVSDWWPDGSANAGFASELAAIQKIQLRQQLGRRYASILRRGESDAVRIMINQEALEAFEHCVWSEDRFVERKGWGNIPARYSFNDVISTQRRCLLDSSSIPEGATACVECGSEEFRTVEERVSGWVGIQRYDDNNKFGIDLVRKGRAIRVGEKDAFFNFVDDVGEAVKEYPTDQQTGRIIGEIHLDHVPVDFQKQDFERSTEEWQRAIQYLRGASLLPSSWEADTRNETPVSKLFQGYRKVRTPGKADMYMGRWDEATGKAVRVSRATEADYFARFLAREPGYFDDAKWWELVEQASLPPIVGFENCPHCGFENLPGTDVCDGCGVLLRSKPCLSCTVEIPVGALQCPICGTSQVPEVEEPWACAVCGRVNAVDNEVCDQCESIRGAENPTSIEVLERDAVEVEEYSFASRVFVMADGRKAEPLEVMTFRVGPIRPTWDGQLVPTIAFKSAGRIQIFLNESHPLFSQMGIRPEQTVATEAAQYLYSMRSDLMGRPGHSVPNIAASVISEVWAEALIRTPELVAESTRALFERIAERLDFGADASDFYSELDDYEQRDLADRLISLGRLDELTDLKKAGAYLRFTGPSVLAKYFRHRPELWFGPVWNDTLPDAADVGAAAAATAREQKVGIYSRCLEDCAAFIRFVYQDALVVSRAVASKEYLEAKHL